MKPFLDTDFLLETDTARMLYHEAASGLPVVDFHNHVDPVSLAENRMSATIGDLWVVSDPYKHRAMRINGIPEYYISGAASPKEKFMRWAETLPRTIGNPLFHWSCMELKSVFDIDEVLNETNAEAIWDTCNQVIECKKLGARDILKHWNTEIACTSDDLLDDLSQHVLASRHAQASETVPASETAPTSETVPASQTVLVSQTVLASHQGPAYLQVQASPNVLTSRNTPASPNVPTSQTENGLSIYPSLRGDSILAVETPGFFLWLERLASIYGKIDHLDDYLEAIRSRLDVFTESGCRLADHSLDAGFSFVTATQDGASNIFSKLIEKQKIISDERRLTKEEQLYLQSFLFQYLGKEYHQRGWTLQLHSGARRQTSSRLRSLAGSAGGYACIGETCNVESLCLYLDSLEKDDSLPNLILYTLNPADNAVLATLTGSFAEDGIAGKIQFGPAWWYNDFQEGIKQQLLAVSGYGLLSRFIGMTTDSRSVLSFSRHDYFRRILCNMLGSWVEKGQIPGDMSLLKQMVLDIAYHNSRKLFR